MPVTYGKPTPTMFDALEHLLDTHLSRLKDAGVGIDLLAAYGPVNSDGETTGPAIKHEGDPCSGLCKITSLKWRALGVGDVVITLDDDQWPGFTTEERLAVLHHELLHIELVEDERGVVADDLGRPRLKSRKHDHHFGWFDEVAALYGKASHEVQQATRLVAETGQLYFGGMGLDDDVADVVQLAAVEDDAEATG